MKLETIHFYEKDYPDNLISTVFPPYREYPWEALKEALDAVDELKEFDRDIIRAHFEFHYPLKDIMPKWKVQKRKDVMSKAVCKFAFKIMENRAKNGKSYICTEEDILNMDVNFLTPNTYVRYRIPKMFLDNGIRTIGDLRKKSDCEIEKIGWVGMIGSNSKHKGNVLNSLKKIGLDEA